MFTLYSIKMKGMIYDMTVAVITPSSLLFRILLANLVIRILALAVMNHCNGSTFDNVGKKRKDSSDNGEVKTGSIHYNVTGDPGTTLRGPSPWSGGRGSYFIVTPLSILGLPGAR